MRQVTGIGEKYCEDVHCLRRSVENLLVYTKSMLTKEGWLSGIKLETGLDFVHVFLFMFIFTTWMKI